MHATMPSTAIAAKMSKDEGSKKRKRPDDDGVRSKSVKKQLSSKKTSSGIQQQIFELENTITNGQDIAKNVSALLSLFKLEERQEGKNLPVLVSLCKVFTRLIVSGEIATAMHAQAQSTRDSDTLRKHYEKYHEYLQLSIRNGSAAIQAACLKLSMRMLKAQAEHLEENVFSSSIYTNLVTVIIDANDGTNVRSLFIDDYLTVYDECKFFTLETISSYASQPLVASAIDRLIDILSSLKSPSAQGNEDVQYFIESSSKLKKKGKDLITRSSISRAASAAWLTVLSSSSLTVALRKRLLEILAPTILPWLTRPEILFDFLTTSFDQGDSLSLHSLSGMFHLMTTKNLDYPSFYAKLYSLLTPSLMHSKHRSRFLRHLQTFLSSTHLPATLVASFIKRLSGLCLYSPPAAIVAVVPYLYNLFKSHPQTTFMIHRAGSTGSQDPNHDAFDPLDPNPLTTNAISSSLWELHTLASSTALSTSPTASDSGHSLGHYHPNVSSLCQIICLQFTKQQYNTEDFLDHSYTSMLDAELRREMKKEPVVEWKIPKRIFLGNSEGPGTDLIRESWSFD